MLRISFGLKLLVAFCSIYFLFGYFFNFNIYVYSLREIGRMESKSSNTFTITHTYYMYDNSQNLLF